MKGFNSYLKIGIMKFRAAITAARSLLIPKFYQDRFFRGLWDRGTKSLPDCRNYSTNQSGLMKKRTP